MRRSGLAGWFALAACALAFCLEAPVCWGQDTEPPATPEEEQPEVLTRGPVHEAFAGPVISEKEERVVAPTEPPMDVQEVPPAERPEGADYVWAPGYWAWDSDRQNYIWVSGCWRQAPPKMRWVAGYWTEADGGWTWVAGFWEPMEGSGIEYLPAPPAALSIAPVAAPPTPDHIWVPPCWYWRGGQYIERSGYWIVAQRDWVWVPSHYVWTPRGYIFVRGHWDRLLERRGVLFAPVYFPPRVRARWGYVHSPTIALDLGAVRVSLFAYPRYHHYFFGDYYDDVYVRVGIYPWCDNARPHGWYDPFYAHERWRQVKANPRWEEMTRREYDVRRVDKDMRPPRTYTEMNARMAKAPEPQRKVIRIAEPLDTMVKSKTAPARFERIDNDARQKIAKQAYDWRKQGDEQRRAQPAQPLTGATESRGAGAPDRKVPPATGPSRDSRGVIIMPERKTPATTPGATTPGSTTPGGARDSRGVIIMPERKTPATTPGEPKGTKTPSMDRKDGAVAPVEREQRAVTPSTERKGAAPTLTGQEQDGTKAAASERTAPTAPSTDRQQRTQPARPQTHEGAAAQTVEGEEREQTAQPTERSVESTQRRGEEVRRSEPGSSHRGASTRHEEETRRTEEGRAVEKRR